MAKRDGSEVPKRVPYTLDQDSLTPEQRFWADPHDESLFPEAPKGWRDACKPDFYIDMYAASEYYVTRLLQHAELDWSILELGANCGRNLHFFQEAGFENLSGIELNEDTIRNAHVYYPGVAPVIQMGTIQELLPEHPPVDIIFTSVVLMHIPWDDDWVLDLITEKAQKLIMITEIENSSYPEGLKFERDYRNEFEIKRKGWRQVEFRIRTGVHKIGGCTMRIFKRV